MKKDTSEYAPSKAPETQKDAEQGSEVVDPRLLPGGAEPRTPTDQGMAGLDSDAVPNRATGSGQTRDRDTGKDAGE